MDVTKLNQETSEGRHQGPHDGVKVLNVGLFCGRSSSFFRGKSRRKTFTLSERIFTESPEGEEE